MKKTGVQMLSLIATIVVTPLLAQPLHAAPSVSGIDPSVGSYPYFAALSARCEASPARTAALGRYKRQYLAMLRKSGDMMGKMPDAKPADIEKYNQRIASLETRDLAPDELAPFVAMFAKAKPREIASMCATFDRDMAQRSALNELILNPPKSELPKNETGQTVPPIRILSLQHLHALMVSCEKTDPDASRVAARAEAFKQAVPRARTPSGVYRTEVGVDGKYKETLFPSAAVMIKSPEFEVDTKRYLAVVAQSSESIQQHGCKGFVEIMDRVGK